MAAVGGFNKIEFRDEDILPGFKAQAWKLLPPKVPSHPLLVSVHPDFVVQHIPFVPHQEHGPCL